MQHSEKHKGNILYNSHFLATLRENIDPFNTYTDAELTGVIQSVGLEQPLDKDISENGENLSVGERQLV